MNLTRTLAAVAILATACGTPPAAKSGDTEDPQVKYAQCMRSNGVANFPDPVNGRLEIRYGKDGVDPNSPQFKSAQAACKNLAPAGTQQGSADNQQVKQMLKFAACMREHGVKNFPDPKDGNLLIDGVDPNTPQFKAAMTACKQYMPGGGP
ncbi:hypothetical protein [Nonomuraea sediminis]|uniref:hypothetical protein n=1 Tax=Nonomuraea sediminis TaxID=2835864 RepID=UPI001BDCE81F|nr:hypothetical protein [Nonomuraea sediminis]